jgi:hypothetical protein
MFIISRLPVWHDYGMLLNVTKRYIKDEKDIFEFDVFGLYHIYNRSAGFALDNG